MTELEDALRRAEERLDEKDYAILRAVVDAVGRRDGFVEKASKTSSCTATLVTIRPETGVRFAAS